MNTLNIKNLLKNDYCYLEALKQALTQRGNFDRETTECLNDLKYLFAYRIELSKQQKQIDQHILEQFKIPKNCKNPCECE